MSRHLPALACLLLAACPDPLPLEEDAPRTRRDAGMCVPSEAEDCLPPIRSVRTRISIPDWLHVDQIEATPEGEACLVARWSTTMFGPLSAELAGAPDGDVVLLCFTSNGLLSRAHAWPTCPDGVLLRPDFPARLAVRADGRIFVTGPTCQGDPAPAFLTSLNPELQVLQTRLLPLDALRDVDVVGETIAIAGATANFSPIDDVKVHGAFVVMLEASSLRAVRVLSDPILSPPYGPYRTFEYGIESVALRPDGQMLIFGRGSTNPPFTASSGRGAAWQFIDSGDPLMPLSDNWLETHFIGWNRAGDVVALGGRERPARDSSETVEIGAERMNIALGEVGPFAAAMRGNDVLLLRAFRGELQLQGVTYRSRTYGSLLVEVGGSPLAIQWSYLLDEDYALHQLAVLPNGGVVVWDGRAQLGSRAETPGIDSVAHAQLTFLQ